MSKLLGLVVLLFLISGGQVRADWTDIARTQLSVEDRPSRLDAMVVLGGDTDNRMKRAVEVYRQYHPRLVILSGFGEIEVAREMLLRAGVKPDQIVIESRSTSTLENARFSLPLLDSAQAREVGLVTSWYHTRRSKRTFESFHAAMRFYALGTRDDRPAADAKLSAQELKQLREETVKIGGYWFLYGISPL